MRTIKAEKVEDMMEPMQSEKKHYPKFRIGLKHLPEAKKWEIGKTYMVTLKLRQTGIAINDYADEASFDILGVEAKGGKKQVKRYSDE